MEMSSGLLISVFSLAPLDSDLCHSQFLLFFCFNSLLHVLIWFRFLYETELLTGFFGLKNFF